MCILPNSVTSAHILTSKLVVINWSHKPDPLPVFLAEKGSGD